MPRPVYSAKRQVWRDGGVSAGTRQIPEETALALTYNGGTYAVMMGTPHDLADFAVGFSLSEGIVQSPDEIETFDIVEVGDGISQARPDAASAASSRLRRPSAPPRSFRRDARSRRPTSWQRWPVLFRCRRSTS